LIPIKTRSKVRQIPQDGFVARLAFFARPNGEGNAPEAKTVIQTGKALGNRLRDQKVPRV
jgi:hypothetical protein